jgi:hypothetical protein
MNPNDPISPDSRDELGDRMKMYEHQWCYGRPNPDAPPSERLTPGLPVCVRIDGRAFHTFAAGLTRPYDTRLAALMVSTTRRLVEETNARVGYTQSDEISLVLMQESDESTPYFGGRVQKTVSMLAAVASAHYPKVPHLACVSYHQEMEPVGPYTGAPRPGAPLFGKVWVRGKFRLVTEAASTELGALELLAAALGVELTKDSSK